MKRRSLLQGLMTLPAAPFLKAQEVNAKPAEPKPDEPHKLEFAVPDSSGDPIVPEFFTAAQFASLEKLCNAIAPSSTSMPGARAGGVPAFLDFLIGQSPADREKLYRDGLDNLDRAGFSNASPSKVESLLAPLRTPWKRDGGEGQERFLRTAKDDILEATENSREWMAAMSKRNRSYRGLGHYWRVME
jgi:Gluconate 2-dehydrogenase subunit 3